MTLALRWLDRSTRNRDDQEEETVSTAEKQVSTQNDGFDYDSRGVWQLIDIAKTRGGRNGGRSTYAIHVSFILDTDLML